MRSPSDTAPPAWQQRSYGTIVGFAFLVPVAGQVLLDGERQFSLLNQWLIYSVAASGFALVFCVAGRFAFCQTFMMAVGAYSAANAGTSYSFLPAVLVALAVTTAVASVLALLLWRTDGLLFAIATLAVVEVGTIVFTHWTWFTGEYALRSNVPVPDLFGLSLDDQRRMSWLFVAVLAATLLMIARMQRTAIWRDVIASNVNPAVARACGVPTRRVQATMFIMGSALGGLSGALFAYWQGAVSHESFGLATAIGLLLMPIVGGGHSMWGPVAGAGFYIILPVLLSNASRFTPLIYGMLLIAAILFFPSGLIGFGERIRDHLSARVRRRSEMRKGHASP